MDRHKPGVAIAALEIPFVSDFKLDGSVLQRDRRSNLGKAAIDKQFRSSDVAAVVGCEEQHCFRNFLGDTDSAERNSAGNLFQLLAASFCGMPCGSVDVAWTHCIHSNVAILQIGGPSARERTDCRFSSAINTPVRQALTCDDGRIE